VIKLAKLVWEFVKTDFDPIPYSFILLWATFLLVLNYNFNIENSIIDMLPTNGARFIGYFILYSVSYYVAVIIRCRFKSDYSSLKNKRFWIISLAGLFVFSSDSGFVFHQYLVNWINPTTPLNGFTYSLLSNGTEFISIALPLFILNTFIIQNRNENLGVNKKEIDIKPFFWILAIITPFIFFSAYESGLNNYYPTFRYHGVAAAWGISKWIPIGLYELLYGLDFFNVELCFRGFFVIGMTAVLGQEAVIPMAVFYCTIHFGKPGAEAISSLFGGYILGAITYQTRSIWGGVIVHIGLAWMMELSAFVVKGLL